MPDDLLNKDTSRFDMKKNNRPKVALVRSDYQPNNEELEEPIEFPEDLTPDDLAKIAMKSVEIVRTSKPE